MPVFFTVPRQQEFSLTPDRLGLPTVVVIVGEEHLAIPSGQSRDAYLILSYISHEDT